MVISDHSATCPDIHLFGQEPSISRLMGCRSLHISNKPPKLSEPGPENLSDHRRLLNFPEGP